METHRTKRHQVSLACDPCRNRKARLSRPVVTVRRCGLIATYRSSATVISLVSLVHLSWLVDESLPPSLAGALSPPSDLGATPLPSKDPPMPGLPCISYARVASLALSPTAS